MTDIEALTLADIRGHASDDQKQYLRSKSVLEAWRTELLKLQVNLETQLRERKISAEAFHEECKAKGDVGAYEWKQYNEDYQKWRRSASFMINAVSDRAIEAKALRRQRNMEMHQEKHEVASRLLIEVLRDLHNSENLEETRLRILVIANRILGVDIDRLAGPPKYDAIMTFVENRVDRADSH